jgi:hypothetical protein
MEKDNINVQVDKKFKKKFEKYCKLKFTTVSALIRKMIRNELEKE